MSDIFLSICFNCGNQFVLKRSHVENICTPCLHVRKLESQLAERDAEIKELNLSCDALTESLRKKLDKAIKCLVKISNDKYEANPWTIIYSGSAKIAKKFLDEMNSNK